MIFSIPCTQKSLSCTPTIISLLFPGGGGGGVETEVKQLLKEEYSDFYGQKI
jgi:hypothetical protein